MNEELNNDVTMETTTQETAPAVSGSGNSSLGALLLKTAAVSAVCGVTYVAAAFGTWKWCENADERKERREARRKARKEKKALKKAKKAPKPHIDEEVCVETDPVTE